MAAPSPTAEPFPALFFFFSFHQSLMNNFLFIFPYGDCALAGSAGPGDKQAHG